MANDRWNEERAHSAVVESEDLATIESISDSIWRGQQSKEKLWMSVIMSRTILLSHKYSELTISE
jgi:hypothetical protein